MSAKPTFTAVMPVYNGEKHIIETLGSVLTQTYPPAQIIVVDDESLDNAGKIVRSYGGRVLLVHQKNGGQSAARNHGVSLATTDWIAFVDQDDVWLPNHLEEMAQAIQRRTDADLCYSGRRELVHDQGGGEPHLSEPVKLPGEDALASVMIDRCPFQPSSTAVRRSTLLRVGGWNSAFDSVEDWDLWLRLLGEGSRAVYTGKVTMHYRIHPGAATNQPVRVLEKSIHLVRERIAPLLPVSKRAAHCLSLIHI